MDTLWGYRPLGLIPSPIITECLLLRLHMPPVSVYGAPIQSALQSAEFLACEGHLTGAQVLKNPLLVLGAGDGDHIGILVEHPG